MVANKKHHYFVSLFILFSISLCCHGSYDPYLDKVQAVSDVNFRKILQNNTNFPIMMVEFYAPWCGHCQKLSPVYKKLAADLNDIVPLLAVNCDEYKSLCAEYDIKGYPTLKIVKFDLFKPGSQRQWIPYEQSREYSSMRKTLEYYYPDDVLSLSDQSDKDALLKKVDGSLATVVYFNSPQNVHSLDFTIKRLAFEWKNRMNFVRVSQNNAILKKQFSSTNDGKLPTISVLEAGDPTIVHSMQDDFSTLNYISIKRFLLQYLKLSDAAVLLGIPWIHSSELLEKLCLHASGICIISLFDVSLAKRQINVSKLRLLRSIKKSLSQSTQTASASPSTFSFYSMERSQTLENSNPIFKNAKDKNQIWNSSLIIIHGKRQKYGLWNGPDEWTEASIMNLVNDLKYGDFPMSNFPMVDSDEKEILDL